MMYGLLSMSDDFSSSIPAFAHPSNPDNAHSDGEACNIPVGGRVLPDASYQALSDNDLAFRARQDPLAFEHLFHRFFHPVYRYYFSRIRSHEDAEDLTSETFRKMHLHLRDFDGRGTPFSAWFFRIAHNTLIDHVRRSSVRRQERLDNLPTEKETSVACDAAAYEPAFP